MQFFIFSVFFIVVCICVSFTQIGSSDTGTSRLDKFRIRLLNRKAGDDQRRKCVDVLHPREWNFSVQKAIFAYRIYLEQRL